MIATVTMNASVDKAYVIDTLLVGEVTRVQKCTNTPGGKGLNVARVIKCCGEEVLATGLLGGHNGAYIKEMLDQEQIASDFLYTASESRCCINILEKDGTSTELLEPGESVSEKEVHEFVQKFEQMINRIDIVTISGSVPTGVNANIYSNLIKLIKEKGKKVILDTSGNLLKEGIHAGPTMIKPNKDEIEALLGMKVNNREKMIEGAKQLQGMGIDLVVVSLGAQGAILVSKNKVLHGQAPKIKTVNTVGSGDSMVAVFAVAMERGMDLEEMLRYAVAVSSANTLTMKTGSFHMEDMEKLYNKVVVQNL